MSCGVVKTPWNGLGFLTLFHSLLLFNIFCMMRAQMFELKIMGCGMFMRVASRCNYYFSRQPLPTSICKATLNSISEAILHIWTIQRHFSRLWLLIPNNLDLCGNVDPYLSVFIILRHLWCVWSLKFKTILIQNISICDAICIFKIYSTQKIRFTVFNIAKSFVWSCENLPGNLTSSDTCAMQSIILVAQNNMLFHII